MVILKSDGSSQQFDTKKVKKAITNAMKSGSGVYYPKIAEIIAEETETKFSKKETVSHKEIDKFIINRLIEYGQSLTATAYERYKTTKAFQNAEGIIDDAIAGIIDGTNKEAINENSNKKAELCSTQRDLIAGEESRSYSIRKLIPTHIANAHREGLIHFHDMDYMIHPIHNCCLINLKDMFENGTVINDKMIETPKSFQTACTIATQISLQIANGQYGGQTFTVSHLAPYLRVSKNKYRKMFTEAGLPADKVEELTRKMLHQELSAGCQTIQFQENTFSSSNGQTPFVSIFLYISEDPEYRKETAMIIEEILKQRFLGMKNKDGVYVTPAFPKLLFVTDEDNIPEDSEYHHLFKLAVRCSARRMNPDYISAKIMKQNYEGNVFPCMGCRSMLAPWKNEEGKYKFYGRFNRGVVSLNLVDVALSSKKDMDKFWMILDERLELVKESLLIKDSLVRRATSDVSPIHWQYGGIARLEQGEKIARLLDNGYSSISLGYVGMYEMTKYMLGISNTTPEGKEFALKVIKYLKQKTIEWKQIPGLHGCALYGTPGESLNSGFANKTRKRFGIIPDITDKDYFTNSYHVNVKEEINAFDKLKFESEFQGITTGGAISYIEIPNMEDNIDALEDVVKFMYDNIMYGEVNTRNGDVCGKCGFTGEILCDDNNEWYCPKCGNRDKERLTVVRRTCGYIGSSFWCHGRTSEIKERVMHL